MPMHRHPSREQYLDAVPVFSGCLYGLPFNIAVYAVLAWLFI